MLYAELKKHFYMQKKKKKKVTDFCEEQYKRWTLGEKCFKCNNCDVSFSAKSLLYKHIIESHALDYTQVQINKFNKYINDIRQKKKPHNKKHLKIGSYRGKKIYTLFLCYNCNTRSTEGWIFKELMRGEIRICNRCKNILVPLYSPVKIIYTKFESSKRKH